MKFLLMSLSFVFLFGIQAYAQDMVQTTPQQDSTLMPILDYSPKVIKIKQNGQRFLEQEVKIMNRGGSTLQIQNVVPACKCGSFKVLRGIINPMTFGKMILSLNTDSMGPDQEFIDFEVISNAKNSPVTIRFEVIKD